MTTDVVERSLEAVVAILNADVGIQALTGRSSGNCVTWGTYEDDNASPQDRFPVLLYEFAGAFEMGGLGDSREVTVRITAVADGNGAQATCSALLERVELGLTQPRLSAEGMDAAVIRRTRLSIDSTPEGSRALVRSDLELTLWVTK